MRLETISQIGNPDDETTLPLALLLHRIGDELYDMSTTCRNVENALGVVISSPEKQIDQPIMAIQGLDRIRQTVEDLARLTRAIARTQSLSETDIPLHKIKRAVILTGLMDRLTGTEVDQVNDTPENHDVIWT